MKDQNFYACFLYSLASICIVSPILTIIIVLCVIILMKTICFICRCNCCCFFSFVFVIDKQIDIGFFVVLLDN